MKLDAEIQKDVMNELKWDPSVTHERIGVAVSDGIVTLSGSVPNYIEKSAAEKAAQRVAGVRAVVEKIEVRVPGSFNKNDQDIANAIVTQFLWHAQIPHELVKVTVENGWVVLSGELDWEYQRRAAEKVVKGLAGVRGVTNSLTIKARAVEPATIKTKIEEALERAAEREARHINVQVEGNRVILAGKVRSFADLRDVRGAAWSAPGVTGVDDTAVSVGS